MKFYIHASLLIDARLTDVIHSLELNIYPNISWPIHFKVYGSMKYYLNNIFLILEFFSNISRFIYINILYIYFMQFS